MKLFKRKSWLEKFHIELQKSYGDDDISMNGRKYISIEKAIQAAERASS